MKRLWASSCTCGLQADVLQHHPLNVDWISHPIWNVNLQYKYCNLWLCNTVICDCCSIWLEISKSDLCEPFSDCQCTLTISFRSIGYNDCNAFFWLISKTLIFPWKYLQWEHSCYTSDPWSMRCWIDMDMVYMCPNVCSSLSIRVLMSSLSIQVLMLYRKQTWRCWHAVSLFHIWNQTSTFSFFYKFPCVSNRWGKYFTFV